METNSYEVKSLDLKNVIHLPLEKITKIINKDYYTIYVDYNTLVNNYDKVIEIVKYLQILLINSINVENYECALFINNNLKDRIDLQINILDDFENKNRNYINKNEIDKVRFSVPLSYLMWGPNFDDYLLTHMVHYQKNAIYANGNIAVNKDALLKIKDIILKLKDSHNYSDLQKIILVANYLQSNVQYISDNMFSDFEYDYVVNTDKEELKNITGLVETILFNGYGLCTGIANSTTLLLNNPIFNIDCRSLVTDKHALNIVKCSNKYYLLDNTYGITRSNNEFSDAIKPKRFNDKYLLLGYVSRLYHYDIFCTDNPNLDIIEFKNFKSKEILKVKKQMEDRLDFNYSKNYTLSLKKIKK